MIVHKFGGASVKEAASVKNLAKIISETKITDKLIVVISAMGKTTNAFEKLLELYFNEKDQLEEQFEEIKNFHFAIINDLFPERSHPIFEKLHNIFVELEWEIEDSPTRSLEYHYGQIVSIGEVLSTTIVSEYLAMIGIENNWMDARGLIRLENGFINGSVNWEESHRLTTNYLGSEQNNEVQIFVTQGFIGGTSENFTATLGREGSDFSAAIFASILNSEEVIIWKDVDGMYNADPKFFNNVVKLNNISYLEAIELAYYGASVIHPKTIKPLQNKSIPLKVKSFINPSNKGTLIDNNTALDSIIPSFIHKENQILISIGAKDFSFVVESNLSDIFSIFNELGISINMMQNSAISFSVCVDNSKIIPDLIDKLTENYAVSYNSDLELLTIRHYSEETIEELIGSKKIYLEQKSRNTARFVLKS